MKRMISALICMMVLFGVVACGNTNSTQDSMVIDCAGDEVQIPDEITKIVCVSQNAMEFIVAMGHEDKLVGVHKSIFNHTWSCEFMNNLDTIKGFGYSPSAEALYEIGADLVIVKEASVARELRTQGLSAITFQYTNEEEMFRAVEMLGDIFGSDAQKYAKKWMSCYETVEDEIKSKTNALSESEKKVVYFIDASTALDSGNLCSTVGGDSIIATWFETVGVPLVTKEYSNINSINEEEILEMNPETIFIGGWAENTRYEQLFKDEKWSDIIAVKNQDVHIAPVGFVSFERYAVEAPLLLKYSAQQMYPDLFDYDMISEFKEFFVEFYGLDVSEEKIEHMFGGLSPDGTRMDK